MKLISTLLIFLFFVWNVSSQETETLELNDYKSEFLIPFNDHGKWGWCDTLGEIKSPVKFLKTSFFDHTIKREFGKFDRMAEIETEIGKNYLHDNGHYFIPSNLGIVKEFWGDLKDIVLVKNKENKYGLFDLKENDLTVPPIHDDYLLSYTENVIFLKQKNKSTYSLYSIESKTLKPTSVVETDVVYGKLPSEKYADNIDLFKSQNGTISYLKDGSFHHFKKSEIKQFSEYPIATAAIESPKWENIKEMSVSKDDCDNEFKQVYLKKNHNSPNSEMKFVQISCLEGKLGLIDNSGFDHLPFIYDKIELFNRGWVARMYHGDKVGMLDLTYDNPAVEPIFESLKFSRKIRIPYQRSFNIYEIELNGQKAYLGENGVRYFDLF